MDVIERASGIGEVYIGETLVRGGVTYDITVVQDQIPTRRGTTIPGMKDVLISVDLTDAEYHHFLGKDLTLHLQDVAGSGSRLKTLRGRWSQRAVELESDDSLFRNGSAYDSDRDQEIRNHVDGPDHRSTPTMQSARSWSQCD